MNDKWLAILQLAISGVQIATADQQAVQFLKVIGQATAAYKEMTGKDVDPDVIKEYERIE